MEVGAQGEALGLVELADGGKTAHGGGVAAELDLEVAELLAEDAEDLRGQAVGVGFNGLDAFGHGEDVAEIDEGVAGHGEGELGLAEGVAFDGGDEQGAGIEDGDHGGEPALVVVLRAVVAEERVGDVGFEDFGGPALPLGEELDELEVAVFVAVAADELGGGGWRAGAAVEQRHGDLAAAEGLVDDGDVADDEGHEAEAGAGFGSDEDAGELAFGGDVA